MLWFATLIAVNLQTAFLSPPVAMSAYYLKGVAPAWSLRGHLPRHGSVHDPAAHRPGPLHHLPEPSHSGSRGISSASERRALAMKTRRLALTWIAFALPVLILAAAIWRGPGDAAAQQKFVWKVQSTWPATNLLHVSALELAKMVEEMSGGRLKWEMSAAGTIVGRLRGARCRQPRHHRRLAMRGRATGRARTRRPACSARARRALRHGPRGIPRLALRRRRARALQRAAPERAEDERGGPGLHDEPAVLGAARLVQEAVQQPRRPAQDALPHLGPRHGDDEDAWASPW